MDSTESFSTSTSINQVNHVIISFLEIWLYHWFGWQHLPWCHMFIYPSLKNACMISSVRKFFFSVMLCQIVSFMQMILWSIPLYITIQGCQYISSWEQDPHHVDLKGSHHSNWLQLLNFLVVRWGLQWNFSLVWQKSRCWTPITLLITAKEQVKLHFVTGCHWLMWCCCHYGEAMCSLSVPPASIMAM